MAKIKTARPNAHLIYGATLFVIGLLLFGTPAALAEEGRGRLVVIVNNDNPINQLNARELREIFLNKRSAWVNGEEIESCDLAEKALAEEKTAQALFSTRYLHKDIHTLKSYWIRMIFSGRGEPPAAYKTARQVKRFVAEHVGGIGYLYERDVTDDVKKIDIVSN